MPLISPPLLLGKSDSICRLAAEISVFHTTQWTPKPWFLVLGFINLSSEQQIALLPPLLAISTAFGMLTNKDPRLREKALHNYQIATKTQQDLLARFVNTVPHKFSHTTLYDILLSLLLVGLTLLEFEMMYPMYPQSWLLHAKGIVQLLDLVGPRRAQQSPFFEIFRHLRFIDVGTHKIDLPGILTFSIH